MKCYHSKWPDGPCRLETGHDGGHVYVTPPPYWAREVETSAPDAAPTRSESWQEILASAPAMTARIDELDRHLSAVFSECGANAHRIAALELQLNELRQEHVDDIDHDVSWPRSRVAPAPELPAIGKRVNCPIVMRRVGKVVGHRDGMLEVELPGGGVHLFAAADVEVEG